MRRIFKVSELANFEHYIKLLESSLLLIVKFMDFSENFYSMDLIHWRIIEWGNKKNFKFYNLAGFNPNPASKKEEGIYQYKKKWGGKRYDYYNIFN